MLDRQTVLVLGAGSSVEFKLPAGDGLANVIAGRTFFWHDRYGELSRGDLTLYRALKNRFATPNAVLMAGRRISEGLPLSRSIDDFLYNHGHDECLVATGKAAIVQSILEAERSSSLMRFYAEDAEYRSGALADQIDTWIYKLFSFIQTGVRLSEVDSIFEGLSVINFNYDRCVETFFYHALQRAYGIEAGHAAEIVAKLDITHPYGVVGRLPWQLQAGEGVGFGLDASAVSLLDLADQIKTFTEQAHDEAEKEHWRNAIAESDQVIFLGFGFHRQNVALLRLLDGPQRVPRVHATTYGASIPDQDVFRDRLYSLMAVSRPEFDHNSPLRIELSHSTCSKLIMQHGLQLFS